jgi:tripartite-type tricarboxylate transporter receptor subunit TctC
MRNPRTRAPRKGQRRGAIAAACLTIGIACAGAHAQSYPSRPIRLVTPFPAGGTAEVLARAIAVQVEAQLGQPVVVDSRGGANGIIGTEIVARAAPDGYTALHVTASFVINPHIYRKLPYHYDRDFVPVTSVVLGTGYLVLVHPAVPARTLQELIALAKKDSRLTYGSPGVGNTLHLAAEFFNVRAGTRLVHVPYKGVAPAMNAAIAGEVQAIFMPATIAIPMVKAGKLRALAFTANKRLAELPDVPTSAEAGLELPLSGAWHGWFVPARTPAAIVQRLHAEAQKALGVPKVRDFILAGGYEPDGRSPAAFREFVRAEYERYGEMVRAAKLEPQ